MDPVVGKCGHTICRVCHMSIIENSSQTQKYCPVCRTVLEATPVTNYSLRTVVESLSARCKLCEFSSTVANVKDHLGDCDLVSIGCPNAGCDETVLRRDAVEHRGICPMELVQCDHCQKDMARRVLASHISVECIGRRVECEFGCNATSLTRNNLLPHQYECPMVMRRCTVPTCKFWGNHGQMIHHNRSSKDLHIRLWQTENSKILEAMQSGIQVEFKDELKQISSIQWNITSNDIPRNSTGIRSPQMNSIGISWVLALKETNGKHIFYLSHCDEKEIQVGFRVILWIGRSTKIFCPDEATYHIRPRQYVPLSMKDTLENISQDESVVTGSEFMVQGPMVRLVSAEYTYVSDLWALLYCYRLCKSSSVRSWLLTAFPKGLTEEDFGAASSGDRSPDYVPTAEMGYEKNETEQASSVSTIVQGDTPED
eukprot:gene1178-549_t